MKWEPTKQYTPQQLQAMQQDALERVRQMQRRSEQVVRRSPRAPSFFVQEDVSAAHSSQPPPQNVSTAFSHPQNSSHSSQQNTGWSRHTQQLPSVQNHFSPPPAATSSNPLETVMDALGLEQERRLILGRLLGLATDGAEQPLVLARLYRVMYSLAGLHRRDLRLCL